MTARILDGKALAAEIRARLKAEAAKLPQPPTLACLWAGFDASAASYRSGLAKAALSAGVMLRPIDVGQQDLLATLVDLNRNPAIAGILVQTPLPEAFSTAWVWGLIEPAKDVEGVTPHNQGLALQGEAVCAPCTARAAFELVKSSGVPLKGAEAVVVGRSAIVGKPAAMLLADAGATITLCRSTTRDLAAHTRRAEVLVVAAGKSGLVTPDMIRPGAVVVDVGIHVEGGKVRGDVDPAAAEVAGWISPVPGGVGPLTVAMILERTVAAALARR